MQPFFPRVFKLTTFLAALFFLAAFKVEEQPLVELLQPSDERKAQDALPKSQHALWNTLTKTKIHLDKKQGLYSATYPDEVKALVGTEITISGFMLPLEATEKFTHFLLSKRTPTCAFCPPGEPNEIIDVWLEKPVKWDDNLIAVIGTFTLINNPEFGMFFKLDKAKLD